MEQHDLSGATPPRTRFAPSPSGDIHIGNARTALLCWLLARQGGGQFVLRIEDTDEARLQPEALASLQRELRWLGLDWQEGPAPTGGDRGPYVQSERLALYEKYYAELDQRGLTYPCFCSQERLARMRKRQAAAGRPPRYDGTCRNLSKEEVAARFEAGESASLRFRVDPERGVARRVEFEDIVRGPQTFDAEDIGDFIIRRSNGTPAFFFSNAVDDGLMGITHVLRGDDHLSNTPRQLMLLTALGLPAPSYAHASLIVGDDGSPLSKRHGSATVGELREQGYLPLAVVNHLARLGLSFESNDLLSLDQLAEGFDTHRLGRSPARHDLAQLRHWQQEAVAASDAGAFAEWLLQGMAAPAREALPEARNEAFVALVRDNVVMPQDAERWVAQLCARAVPAWSDEAAGEIKAAGSAFYQASLADLAQADPSADGFKPWSKALAKSAGVKGKRLFMPLRAAFSGEVFGPELYRLWEFLGADAVRERLQAARELARGE